MTLKFMRSSFAHRREYYETLVKGKGNDTSNEQRILRLKEVDEREMSFFPPAFFRIFDNSLRIEHPFVAQSLVPSDDIEDLEAVQNQISSLLAASGFILESFPRIVSHMEFVRDIVGVESDHDFSFCSEGLAKWYNRTQRIINEEEEVDEDETVETLVNGRLVLLFYTPMGFAYYAAPEIEWENMIVGVVISHTQMFHLDPTDVTVKIVEPQIQSVEATSNIVPRPFCQFSIVNGQWQPSYNQDELSTLPPTLYLQVVSSRDGNSVGFGMFANRTAVVVGLIGRYSDILTMFEKEGLASMKNPLQNMKFHLDPRMFFLKGTAAVSYLILYIPNDFMPNHPQYKDVTQYALTVMRRCCVMTLFVPGIQTEDANGSTIDNRVQGVVKRANDDELMFFGSMSTQALTTRSEPAITKMVFDDVYEFIRWSEWISPFYKLKFSNKGDPSDPRCIDERTMKMLLANSAMAKNGGHHLTPILYGEHGNKTPEELVEIYMNDSKINISLLLEKAYRVSNLANAARPQKRCAVCDNREYYGKTEQEKNELRKDEDGRNLCHKCYLAKLRGQSDASGQMESTKQMITSMNNSKMSYERDARDLVSYFSLKNPNPIQKFFVMWFFEHWTKSNLDLKWDELSTGNRLGLDHFDDVEVDSSEDIGERIQDLRSAVATLTGKDVSADQEYLAKLIDINYICGQVVDRDDLFKSFREALLNHLIDQHKNRKQLDYKKIKEACDKIIDSVGSERLDKRECVEIFNITACDNLSVTVDLGREGVRLYKYTFNRTVVSNDEMFSAQPLQSEVVATLIEQPQEMRIVNAWCVDKGVLVLTAIGTRIGLVLLHNKFYGRCVDSFIYETEISDAKECWAEYASQANILYIVFATKKDKYVAMVQLSLDFTSATEVRRRPLKFLLPIASYDRHPEFCGFIVDKTATYGSISTVVKIMELDTKREVGKIIDFDPMTLSVVQSKHQIVESAARMKPLHFHTTKSLYDTVVGVSIKPDADNLYDIYVCEPETTRIAKVGLNKYGDIINKIGVAEFAKNPVLCMSHNNQPPTLQSAIDVLPTFPQIDDMFKVNFDGHSIPKFVGQCISKYGLSEIERLCSPSGDHYPVEAIKFEILNLNGPSDLPNLTKVVVDSIRSTMPNILPIDCHFPVAIYNIPAASETNADGDLFGLIDPNEKKGYKAVINFIGRIMSVPQALVSSIPRPSKSIDTKYYKHLIHGVATKLESKFPPTPFLRSTHERDSIVLGLVDIGDSDGSSIFSSLSGIPFTPSSNGTFNMGSTFVPMFEDKSNVSYLSDNMTLSQKAVKDIGNIIAFTVKAERTSLPSAQAIALYSAIACSDLVVVHASNTDFLASVLSMFIEAFDDLNSDIAKLIPIDEDTLPRLPRVVFVTDLGTAWNATKKKLNETISQALTRTSSQLSSLLFEPGITYVHSKLTSYEIARSIADSQLTQVVDSWDSVSRSTGENLARVRQTAGLFAGMSAYIESFMVTDAVIETDEEEDESENYEE